MISDPTVNLVDIWLPTRLHADVAVMRAGREVLIELPLATTLTDAHRIVEVQRATGRRAFVDMFSRFTRLPTAAPGGDRPALRAAEGI